MATPVRLHDIPFHLGLGATAEPLEAFDGTPEWYERYAARTADDGREGRLVSMYTFDSGWTSWEMHPEGHELVVCTAGEIELIQEVAGVRSTVLLRDDRERSGCVAHGQRGDLGDRVVHHGGARYPGPRPTAGRVAARLAHWGMDLNGKRVLVTGAAGGLGQAIARELRRRGASLVLSGRNEVGLRTLAGQLGGADVLVADLTDSDDVERVANAARVVDILVANAGVGSDVALADDGPETIDRSLDTNLRAPMVMATAFAQARLQAGEPGHVVLVGSIASIVASPGTRLYNATKFGLRGFGLSMREELRDTNVGVSIVEPGFIRDAGMFADSGIDLPKGVRTKSPEEVGDAVCDAIVHNRAEVVVAPIEMRAAAKVAAISPRVASAIQRRARAQERFQDRSGA